MVVEDSFYASKPVFLTSVEIGLAERRAAKIMQRVARGLLVRKKVAVKEEAATEEAATEEAAAEEAAAKSAAAEETAAEECAAEESATKSAAAEAVAEAPVAEEVVAEEAEPAKTVSNTPDPAASAPQHSLLALSLSRR